MRTTLTIEDDVFAAVRSIAEAKSVSIGTAVSDLIRKALEPNRRTSVRNGFPVFPVTPGTKPLTPEDVKRAEDEL